jgi:Flp pilus assembly protein TadB
MLCQAIASIQRLLGLHTYVLYLVGIVALMTTKPSLGVSVLVMVVALALGLISGRALWRTAQRRRVYQESGTTPVRR